MNMFKPTKAKTVKEYIASLPLERKTALQSLDKIIRKASSKFKPHFSYNMIGYGSFKYLNYQKKIIDWPIIALASQKNYISVYVCALEKGRYLAEEAKTRLGKVSVGKSCIRFKKIEDLNLSEFRRVLKKAAKSPGLKN